MVSFSVETLAPLVSLSLAVLFAGTLFFLARLHGRVAAMRGAQSELRGLLRACSDAVDGAERSITGLRQAAHDMAGELDRSMEEAERLRVEIDRTCDAARRALERLGPLTAGNAGATPPIPAAAPGFSPLPAGSPTPTGGGGERAAMRLFRETIRGL
ncbi:DUF6468 domain-containing protein [Niveispirillum fermenti]|uniref:DUF6468 domain-containing protein n=1 Tax=Niveispirillum fermenti TaxID=1233113 RepID=UPI003A85EF2F